MRRIPRFWPALYAMLCKGAKTAAPSVNRFAERHCSDGYAVYDWLPTNRHEMGKYGPVNWNKSLHSVWCGNLNRLVRRTKGCTKSVAMAG